MPRKTNKVKCDVCRYMECSSVSYKSYYCTANEKIVQLSVDYPPRHPPKSCPIKAERRI